MNLAKIDNKAFQTYAPPATFIALSYFAGTDRAIQYFPDSKRVGLMLCGTMSGIFAGVVGNLYHRDSELSTTPNLLRRTLTVFSGAISCLAMPWVAKCIYGVKTSNIGYTSLLAAQMVTFFAIEMISGAFPKKPVIPGETGETGETGEGQ